jgi:hypothetical protein
MTEEDRDDQLLSPASLARYVVPGAPTGFAARVTASITSEEREPSAPSPSRTQRWRRGAAIALALVATIAIVVWSVGGARSRGGAGTRVTTTRETIGLAARGVVVAEPHTALRWTVANNGNAVVEQTSGSAFYRVERSGPFEVRTPLGVVSVTGTCFSIEVIEMNKKDALKGAVAGAAIATAVAVTVYEGGVTFANPRGQIQLVAGEAGTVRAGGAPEATPPTTHVAASELAAANARIAKLEATLRSTRSSADEKQILSATRGDPGRYYAPSAKTLREFADTCWIAFDRPGLSTDERPELVDDELSTGVGLTDAERTAINHAYAKVHDGAIDTLRRLYMELTGSDGDAAAALSIDAIADELEAKSPAADELEARRRIARERAGLEPAPTGQALARRPIVERYLRIMVNLGHEAEAAAAGVIGAKRAHELRAHQGFGWNGSVSDYGGCEPESR